MGKQSYQRVQQSWQEILPQSDAFAALLYHKLFMQHPELESLFIRNMGMQGRKLMSMYSTAIEYLDDPERMLPPLMAAGQRHAQYGVSVKDYKKVNAILIATLEEFLGNRFDDDLKNNWEQACTVIEQVMVSATKHAAR